MKLLPKSSSPIRWEIQGLCQASALFLEVTKMAEAVQEDPGEDEGGAPPYNIDRRPKHRDKMNALAVSSDRYDEAIQARQNEGNDRPQTQPTNARK